MDAWLQVTAGQGPAECAWAVVRVVEKMCAEAAAAGLEIRTLEVVPGPEPGTAQSMLLGVSGPLEPFLSGWRGTVQWIARSPFRPEHKRKNWFVAVDALEPVEATRFDPRDVRFETMRASGPGGQHVNRTESAVRVTHVPTGVQASASEERSQHSNRRLALARLAQRLEELQGRKEAAAERARWQAHQALQRGNPVRVLRGS